MGLFNKLLVTGDRKPVRHAERIADAVLALEGELGTLDDDELAGRAAAQRARVATGSPLDDEIAEAFALVREATWRELGIRHYRVQLVGGVVLHQGMVAEMRTGEGKTIVALLAAYLNALDGRGVHVVTANDYLAARDAGTAQRVLGRLGMGVGYITPTVEDLDAKRAAYACDVTYCTAQELGFDHLRDSTAETAGDVTQRGFHFAIIDEVDSVLIDEARTPLILSAAMPAAPGPLHSVARVADRLVAGRDYEVDDTRREFQLTDDGYDRAEQLLGVALDDPANLRTYAMLRNAVEAKELYRRDRDYVVVDGDVLIVDTNTGRTLKDQRWDWGLHQAIEVKEGLDPKPDNRAIAQVTLQHLFATYDRLCGLTGTAKTDEEELAATYGLLVAEIPTHRPVVRRDEPDVLWSTAAARFAAVLDDVRGAIERDQPVLIGTVSVADSEEISSRLDRAGITHEVLNAKNHAREAHIIAQAGRPGSVTVATNMAGRGVDILLGGNPEELADAEIERDGIEPGSVEALLVAEKWASRCAEDRERVRAAGGLRVIGCGRNDSRRVDDQLRGRAGRQGDPGSSRFYLSLDDELLAGLADGPLALAGRLDRPIEGRTVSRAVAKTQLTREGQHASRRAGEHRYAAVPDAQRRNLHELRFTRLAIADADDAAGQLRANAARAVRSVIEDAADGRHGDPADATAAACERMWPCEVDSARLKQCASSDWHGVLLDDFERAAAERREQLGDELFANLVRKLLTNDLDSAWADHLLELAHLRQAMTLRRTSGSDPLYAWAREADELYERMLDMSAQRASVWAMRGVVSRIGADGAKEPVAP